MRGDFSFHHVRPKIQALRLHSKRLSWQCLSLALSDVNTHDPLTCTITFGGSRWPHCGLCEDLHNGKQSKPQLRLHESPQPSWGIAGTGGLKESGGKW